MKAPRRISNKQNHCWVSPDREWLEYHYLTLGKSGRQIAQEVGVSGWTVTKWLDEKGIDSSKDKRCPDEERLLSQYLVLGRSTCQIGKDLGVSPHTIRRWLQDLEVPCRSRTEAAALQRGEASPNWKGGSYCYFKKQSRQAMQDAEVPRVCVRCGSLEGLEVHHKDGDPHNNILENLEFLCMPCHRRVHAETRWLKEVSV